MQTLPTLSWRPLLLAVGLAAAAGMLGGCATVTTVESNVQSFAATPAPLQPGPFRFDRLPSQDQNTQQAQVLEGMAQAALEGQGFTRADAGARYSVQIGAGTADAVLAYPDPFFDRRLRFPYGRARLWHGRLFYDPLWSDREVYITRVHLEIRDVSTGKLVYESTATNEESWFKADKVLPALFAAAMADFPSPPKGVRKVVVKLSPP